MEKSKWIPYHCIFTDWFMLESEDMEEMGKRTRELIKEICRQTNTRVRAFVLISEDDFKRLLENQK